MSVKYLSLSDPEYSKIESAVLETYQNACITWIEQVENKELLERYNAYKNTFSEPNEKRLFHGTSKENINNILENGFDPSRNRACAYGLGTYFSTRAVYSKDYSLMKNGYARNTRKKQSQRNLENDIIYMFVCDVITGKTTQGRSGAILPKEFDSFTDNVNKPDMYIVNRVEACYPHYVVAFTPFV